MLFELHCHLLERKSSRFGTTWELVNGDRIIPLTITDRSFQAHPQMSGRCGCLKSKASRGVKVRYKMRPNQGRPSHVLPWCSGGERLTMVADCQLITGIMKLVDQADWLSGQVALNLLRSHLQGQPFPPNLTGCWWKHDLRKREAEGGGWGGGASSPQWIRLNLRSL